MTYIDQLRSELASAGLPEHQITDILAEIQTLLAGGTTPEDLGPASELAHAIAERPDMPEHAWARLFDTQNPSLFATKVVGWGWDLNVGALAVKLGLLRPDDLDEDVLSAIPASTWRIVESAPRILAGLSTLAAGVALARGRSLVSGINGAGTITRSTSVGLAMTGAGIGLAAWADRASDMSDSLNRHALGAAGSAISLGTNLLSFTDRSRLHPLAGVGFVAVPLAIQLAAFALPVRAGRSRVARA